MKTCIYSIAVGFGLFAGASALADVPLSRPVQRQTDDRDHDLIDDLIGVGRFEDALQICISRIERVDPTTDDAAKWAIRHSEVLSARQLRDPNFGDTEIVAATRPIDQLLASYPKHNRAIFLKTQRIRVRGQAALHQVVRASISSSDETKITAAKELVRVVTATRSLNRQIAELRSTLHRDTDPIKGFDTDLSRLSQALSVDLVSMMLAQTDLFPHGSDDRISAAASAEQAAEDAIKGIPADVPARTEIQRLRVESILKAGQPSRALSEFERLFDGKSEKFASRYRALLVTIQAEMGQQQPAATLLAEYYGDNPDQSPRSIEMDLARLEFLLRFTPEQVGRWFDSIERRGGRYARRRAESIALARVGKMETDSKMGSALLAAEGRECLRSGDPIRAGELLFAAAKAHANGDRALQYATESAAAFASAQEPALAATSVIEIANANRQSAGASAAHLQGIYLLRSGESGRVEQLLRSQIQQWPESTQAKSARSWLCKLLSEQRRFLEAAEAASNIPAASLVEQDVATIAEAWRTAFHESDDLSFAIHSKRFQKSIKPLLNCPLLKDRYAQIAVMLVNRDHLAGLPAHPDQDPFIGALLRFRQGGAITTELQRVPNHFATDARWRLIRDGRALPQRRESIAHLIQQWGNESEPTIETAELSLWSGKVDASIAMLRSLTQASGNDAEMLIQSANLLGLSDDTNAIAEAIRYWDIVSAGTRTGSGMWHDAKLAAIRLLRKSGNHEEANKRASYILMTIPQLDEQQKRRYQSLTP